MGSGMGNHVGDVQASSGLWTRLPPQEHTDWRCPGGGVGDADEYTPRYNPRVYHIHASEHCAGIADQRHRACVSLPLIRETFDVFVASLPLHALPGTIVGTALGVVWGAWRR